MRKSVLFVCLGNICRSPLAQGIARHYDPYGHFDSAGLREYHQGEKPCKGIEEIAKKYNISLKGITSRCIVYPKDEAFDWIICMDEQNYQDLIKLGFCAQKIKKLGEFGFGGADIPDPYYYVGIEGFEKVYSMIKQGVVNLLETF
ncbi:low molecular weight protein-tyrosine-phosphatase [Helicobacter pylori]